MSRADNGKLPAVLRRDLPIFRLMWGVQPADADEQPGRGHDHHHHADPAPLLAYAPLVGSMLIRLPYGVTPTNRVARLIQRDPGK
jgi:hypothetical protein